MPRLLGNIPWLRKLFTRGARPDVRPDLREPSDWEDAVNLRSGSVIGNIGALESIGGEVSRFLPDPAYASVADNYYCTGTASTPSEDVAFWCAAPGDPVLVTISGTVMVASASIPYRADRPLQVATVARHQGAIIFPVDGESDELFFDIEAIKAAYAAGEQTYFALLDLQAITVIPAGPDEWPEHVGNPNIGTGALPGQYVFQLRYYDDAGNRSNFGPATLPIMVAGIQAPIYLGADGVYPGGQTVGGVAATDITTPTQYGIALMWQIDNVVNYAGMELVCTRWNDAQGLAGPGITEVIARIPMQPGQFGMYNDGVPFVYPRDNNFLEVIPVDLTQQEGVNFFAAKAVEYVDNRLIYANIKLKDRIVDLTFRDVNGERTFPFTDRVFTRYNGQEYNDGHADPVNNTYKKSALHNERYSIGLMLWDGNASRSPVVPVADNVLMPERARRKNGDSALYSTGGPIYRTNTECQGSDPVSDTFDAIKQGTRGKVLDGFTNVIQGLNYNPFAPKSPSDPNYVRYKVAPLQFREATNGGFAPNTGFVFDNEYHSLGLGVYGPTNLRAAAPWCKVISPMRTAGARRSIASGMAVYDVFQSNDIQSAVARKTSELRAYFPDLSSGVVPQSVILDIAANPRNYRLKLTPFGYYNETYAYRTDLHVQFPLPTQIRTWGQDLITYMMVQNDPGTGQVGSVNVGEPPGLMGVQGTFSSPTTNNVGFQGYRRLTTDNLNVPTSDTNNPDYLTFMDPTNTDQGAVEIGFDVFSEFDEGRGKVWRIRLTDRVYRNSGLDSGLHFDDQQTRRCHEPFWIAEILRVDAIVPDQNIQQYSLGGQHIAVDRCIGVFEPDQNGLMDLEMFHARPFDAIGRTPTTQRYTYLQEPGGPERAWLCATGNQVVADNFAAIVFSINFFGSWTAPDGTEVYGLYNSFVDIDTHSYPVTYLRFGEYTQLPAPPTGARVVVKYNEQEPILMQGFDCTIAPWTFAPFDRWFNAANGLANGTGNTQVFTRMPLPYGGGIRNPSYILPRDGQLPAASTEALVFTDLASIRQWVVMGHVVTRTPGWMNTGGGDALRWAFPHMHYISRPSLTIGYDSANQNGFNPQFDTDFPNEAQYFGFGGFRFVPQFNLDYSRPALITGLGIPANGEDPRTELPTGHIASEIYDPLVQDRPGLRTFSFDNLFVASEENGEVKMIASLDGMLYSITERGVFKIPYNKQILTGADGNAVATQSVSNFWPREEIWLTRGSIGSPDQLWRMAIKANIPAGSAEIDALFFVDRTSAYRLAGGQITDIARGKFQKPLLPVLSVTPGGYEQGYSAVYNRKNAEWWFTAINEDGRKTTFVYSALQNEWTGRFSYQYDQYLSVGPQVFGYRTLSANELGVGDSFITETGPSPIPCEVTTPVFGDLGTWKELMRWRVVGTVPDYVHVFDPQGNLMCVMDSSAGQFWEKLYDSYEGWVFRTLESYNADRVLPQEAGFFVKAGWVSFGAKRITSLELQTKNLR